MKAAACKVWKVNNVVSQETGKIRWGMLLLSLSSLFIEPHGSIIAALP